MLCGEEKMKMSGYGFGGRLSAEFPSQVIVDVTEVCNLKCVHCPHENYVKTKEYGARFLDPALNEKMVNEVRRHGRGITQYIRYSSNGEPLLHRNIVQMIDCAVRHSGTTVTLTTNGTLLNQSAADKLLQTGIDIIDISVDAYKPDTYAAIRRGGSLSVTKNNILNLIRMRETASKRTKIVASFVEQTANASEAEDFEKYWKEMGADYVVIRRLHSFAGAKVEIAEQLRDKLHVRKPCLYPWERAVLNARGFLAFCPAGWTNKNEICDYRQNTIAETWKGQFYQQLRQAHLRNELYGFEMCDQCVDWQQVRWPEEGRSYADMVADFKLAEED
jgi:MoaA/NifB/PqqE/SkfB family radical SAM enzyme